MECITLEEFLKNPDKWHGWQKNPHKHTEDSKPALLVPVFDPKDPKYQISPEALARLKDEHKRAFEEQQQQSVEPIKNEIKTIDPAILKEMDELSELLYGPD